MANLGLGMVPPPLQRRGIVLGGLAGGGGGGGSGPVLLHLTPQLRHLRRLCCTQQLTELRQHGKIGLPCHAMLGTQVPPPVPASWITAWQATFD